MELRYTVLTRLVLALFIAVFGLQVYRAITRPIGVGEAFLYDRFVRPTARQVWESELPNHDVLYGLLEKRSVGLFHVSPFAVRLPSLLFGILYLAVVWKLTRRWRVVLLLGGIPIVWEGFAHADGTGAAVALCLCGVALAIDGKHLKWIGILLGLSIAANTMFALPVAAVAVLLLVVKRQWTEWCDTVLIPAAVTALIVLVLPVSHAHSASGTRGELSEEQAKHLERALDALRSAAGREPVRIAAAAAAEPVVNFYRAQHRATTWERAASDDPSQHFDYYLFVAAGAPPIEQRHLVVVYRDADFVLARPAPASM